MSISVTKSKLFWRIYLNGLLVIFFVAIVFVILGVIVGQPAREKHTQAIISALTIDLPNNNGYKTALQTRINKLAEELHITIKIYSADNQFVMGTTNAQSLQPLTRHQYQLLIKQTIMKHDGIFYVLLRKTNVSQLYDAYVAIQLTHLHSTYKFILPAILILLCIALTSFPLTRSLLSPLLKLSQTAQDITEGNLHARSHVLRKDEIGTLANNIDRMATSIATRIQKERELLANISHEIRTPLARMQVALELVEDQPETASQYLVQIQDDIRELENLLDEVFAITKLDSHSSLDFQLNTSSIAVSEIINQCIDKFSQLHPKRIIEIDLHADHTLDIDQKLIMRALYNVVDNAHKYSPLEKPITITTRLASSMILITISDQGIGIEDNEYSKIFEPFYRTEKSRNRDFGGIGLGLTLTKRIIISHGGHIQFQANKPQGTQCIIALPLTV